MSWSCPNCLFDNNDDSIIKCVCGYEISSIDIQKELSEIVTQQYPLEPGILKEFPASQHNNEHKRRWFSSDYFDIFLWQDNKNSIVKFQLCYDIAHKERALTWTHGMGFCHNSIDCGEKYPTKNHSPILLEDGLFPASEVLEKFTANSHYLEEQVRAFIIEKLSTYHRQNTLSA